MIIRINNDLKEQKIFANGDELANIMGLDRENGKRVISYPRDKEMYVHKFNDPILMTDSYRISRLNPTLRDTLLSLYESRPRIVEYDGVSTVWNEDYPTVWCPSIDSLLFLKALRIIFVEDYFGKISFVQKYRNSSGDDFKKVKINIKNFKRAVEIGCGSGILSKYLLSKSNIEQMFINDINPHAIRCAMDNLENYARFDLGDGLKLLEREAENQKFDLIICNAPYVPRIDSMGGNPYEGIELLNHLVHEGQRYLNNGGIIITNISSLGWNLIFQKSPEMLVHVIQTMEVPLKVNNILNNKAWLKYLKELGLEKKKGNNRGYEYWQRINITVLFPDD